MESAAARMAQLLCRHFGKSGDLARVPGGGFRLPTEALEEQFVKEAAKLGMKGLKGHRSVGGIRASVYNAFPMEGVDALVSFMSGFAKKNG